MPQSTTHGTALKFTSGSSPHLSEIAQLSCSTALGRRLRHILRPRPEHADPRLWFHIHNFLERRGRLRSHKGASVRNAGRAGPAGFHCFLQSAGGLLSQPCEGMALLFRLYSGVWMRDRPGLPPLRCSASIAVCRSIQCGIMRSCSGRRNMASPP